MVALFPLRTVLVPGLVLPLHIFEPRYRLMIHNLLEFPPDERGFGIVAIRPGASACESGADIFDIGTMARITSVEALPDGRYDIVTVGARRFSILGLDDDLPYLRAHVRLHPEPIGDPQSTQTLAHHAVELLSRYRALIAEWGVIDMAPLRDLPEDPVVLSYLVGSAVVCDLCTHQRLLAMVDAQMRLKAVCELIAEEIAAMTAVPSMPAVDMVSPSRSWWN